MTDIHRILAIAAVTASTLLALVFLRAAWHKASDLTRFSGFLDGYGLVPETLVEPAARLLLGLEGAAVLLLVMPWTAKIGSLLAMALLLLYALAIGLSLARGRRTIDCGCGGASQPLSAALPVRNLVLCVIATLPLAVETPVLSLGEAAAAIPAGFMLFLLFLVVDQLLANDSHARLINDTLTGKGNTP
ncbi:MauE/DoxX family redox-associated membrane protein [Rhodospirillum sp. A1_3_36]|uniref:MauE/DoxX family redox-associated membrane protein n=1 Tax=Rhodospirillum sp. A1_3_36 TaxID=3391666 RepID=UPI0039A6BFBC